MELVVDCLGFKSKSHEGNGVCGRLAIKRARDGDGFGCGGE